MCFILSLKETLENFLRIESSKDSLKIAQSRGFYTTSRVSLLEVTLIRNMIDLRDQINKWGVICCRSLLVNHLMYLRGFSPLEAQYKPEKSFPLSRLLTYAGFIWWLHFNLRYLNKIKFCRTYFIFYVLSLIVHVTFLLFTVWILNKHIFFIRNNMFRTG